MQSSDADEREQLEAQKLEFLNWDRKRGIYCFDASVRSIFVDRPVADVANQLSKSAAEWHPDVLGKTVTVSEQSAIIFRLKGYPWTQVIFPDFFIESEFLGREWCSELSKRLDSRTVKYCNSDVCLSVGYRLWASGNLIEEFSYVQDQGPKKSFVSTRRTLATEHIECGLTFTDQFLRTEEIFDPGIGFSYFWDYQRPFPGERRRIQDPGLITCFPDGELRSYPPIERVDYLLFDR